MIIIIVIIMTMVIIIIITTFAITITLYYKMCSLVSHVASEKILTRFACSLLAVLAVSC